MVEDSERTPGSAILRTFVLTLVWVFFAGALVTSARVGILLAGADLAEADTDPSIYPPGVVVTIDGSANPVPLAAKAEALRDYYFRLATGGKGAAVAGIVEIPEAVTATTLQQELDLVKVEILSGEHVNRQFWVRRDLLPDPAPIAGER